MRGRGHPDRAVLRDLVDSGSLVVTMLSSGGDPEPPKWHRVFWGVLEGAVAVALLFAGGLSALQTVAILIALPFSVVMLGMCASIIRDFRAERAAMLRAQRKLQREQLTEHVTNSLIDEGLVDPNGANRSGTSSGAGRPCRPDRRSSWRVCGVFRPEDAAHVFSGPFVEAVQKRAADELAQFHGQLGRVLHRSGERQSDVVVVVGGLDPESDAAAVDAEGADPAAAQLFRQVPGQLFDDVGVLVLQVLQPAALVLAQWVGHGRVEGDRAE